MAVHICAVCGKPIDENHPGGKQLIVPRIFYLQGFQKWDRMKQFQTELLINRRENQFYSHNDCIKKGNDEEILDFSRIHFDRYQQRNFYRTASQLIPVMDEFEGMKWNILEKQKFACSCCGNEIHGTSDCMTERRDEKKPYDEENCYLLCMECGTAVREARAKAEQEAKEERRRKAEMRAAAKRERESNLNNAG